MTGAELAPGAQAVGESGGEGEAPGQSDVKAAAAALEVAAAEVATGADAGEAPPAAEAVERVMAAGEAARQAAAGPEDLPEPEKGPVEDGAAPAEEPAAEVGS